MPRTRKPRAAAPADVRPFSPDAPDAKRYGNLSTDAKRKVAEAIRDAKLAGASGDEMRAAFGPLLTGPARRKVLREHGFGSAQTIARTYSMYRDGDARTGTRHAREHGANAGALRREAAAAQAAELTLADCRKLVRAAGQKPAAVRNGDDSALRAQTADAIAAAVA